MNKKLILDRLELLVELCEKTEPDIPTEKRLFTEHSISVHEMIKEVRELHTGIKNIDPDSDRDLMINIMRQANKIWRLRNKVKNGEFDELSHIEMTEQIEDYIAQGQKINAIKYYRQEMSEQFGEQVTLREAKDHIDDIAANMRLRGMTR